VLVLLEIQQFIGEPSNCLKQGEMKKHKTAKQIIINPQALDTATDFDFINNFGKL